MGEPVTLLVIREHELSAQLPAWAAEKRSPRQRQVALELATTGRSYKQMANGLGIAEGTSRKHMETDYRTFGVSSRPEIALLLR